MNIDKVVFEAMQAVFGEAQYTASLQASLVSRLPSSEATFHGGGHYKIELVGPNNPVTFRQLITATNRAEIPVHRVVGTMGGLEGLSDSDIWGLANMADDNGIEFIATPIMPLTNVEGVPEGMHPSESSFFGIHLRRTETVRRYLTQLLRGVQFGRLRSFLIWDFAALDCAQYLIAHGKIPADVKFKASIFCGSSHAVDVHNWMWRNDYRGIPIRTAVTAVNPVALPVAGFAEIRQMIPADVALDIHVTTLDSMGGLDRIEDAHEIIRVAAPVNIKIERGPRVSAMMNEAELFRDVLPKVIESAGKFSAHMKKYPELKMVEK